MLFVLVLNLPLQSQAKISLPVTHALPLLSVASDTVPAAKTDSLAPARLNKDYFINGIQDFEYTLTRPVHWQKKDWFKFSAISAGIGTLMLLDPSIKTFSDDHQSRWLNTGADIIKPLGDYYGMALFPAIYVAGHFSHNERLRSLGLNGSKAVAISSLITLTAKNLIRRNRPLATDNAYDYALPFSKNGFTSTPSGHAVIAFTLATSLAEEFPEKKWVAPVAYSIATLIAGSRIYQNKHWSSDVLLGAALGHFVTRAVYASSKKRHRLRRTF
ncbi:hypothetical protein GCM10027051_10380 [Niabella terrae]